MSAKITAETLRRERERREREVYALSVAYDHAADCLEAQTREHHPEAISLLRAEAKKWRRG